VTGEKDGDDGSKPAAPAPLDRPDDRTRPHLTAAQIERMCSYGEAQQVAVGDVIYQLGDVSYDLILIESGRLTMVIISPLPGRALRSSMVDCTDTAAPSGC
jgi:hypothetical protein